MKHIRYILVNTSLLIPCMNHFQLHPKIFLAYFSCYTFSLHSDFTPQNVQETGAKSLVENKKNWSNSRPATTSTPTTTTRTTRVEPSRGQRLRNATRRSTGFSGRPRRRLLRSPVKAEECKEQMRRMRVRKQMRKILLSVCVCGRHVECSMNSVG